MIKRRKKYFIVLISLIVSLLLCSCARVVENKEKISIVCTAYTQYDMVKEIIGDKNEKFEITYLFDNGADVHSFQTDISFSAKIKIMESDIFIYNGGESDGWVKNILEDESMNKKCIVLSMLSIFNKDELLCLGDHDHDHENAHHNSEYDEHVWLSIPKGIKICEAISQAIINSDKDSASYYEDNTKKYCERLNSIHVNMNNEIQKLKSEGKTPFILVADRFPFRYFVNDYGIEYKAAFEGCSSETSAAYDNIIDLCEEIDKRHLKYILVLEKSTNNVSSSVISASNKDIEIISIDSLQSVSRDDIDSGVTYYDTMKKNFDAIKRAFEFQN